MVKNQQLKEAGRDPPQRALVLGAGKWRGKK